MKKPVFFFLLFLTIALGFYFLFFVTNIIAQSIYCGTERSDVKHLSDINAKSVVFNPVIISLDSFFLLDNIHLTASFSRKCIARMPSEMQVYTVPVYIKYWKLEQDNDYHIVCCDSNYKYKFIAEIPSPECKESIASGYAANYRAARILLDSLFPLMYNFKHYNKYKIKFYITGVLFHDFVHRVDGQAKNGIELHPVLSITYDY